MMWVGMDQNTGRRIDGDAHFAQSEGRILTTPILTRAMRRTFGSELPELISRAATPENRLRLLVAAVDALQRWEPRRLVSHVSLSIDSTAPNTPKIEVNYGAV